MNGSYTPSLGMARARYCDSTVRGDEAGAHSPEVTADEHEKYHAEFDRFVASVRAAAWREGAIWAAIECGAISDPRNQWLAPGDNPYEKGRVA